MDVTVKKTELQTYPAYKDSGVEWLGEIPEHWEVKKLKYVFTEINERSVTGEEELLSLSKSKGVIPKSSLNERSGQANSLIGYKKVYSETIVINKMQAVNGLLAVSKINGITSPDYSIYKIKKNSCSDINYFGYLLNQPDYINEFKKVVTGVMEGFIRLYTDDLYNIKAHIPPPKEQAEIVQFLDDKTAKIDQAISIKQQQIELLKERRQILIHIAVTRGLNENVKLKDSGVEWIGEIPEHWEVKKLKYCLIINNGSDYKHIQTDEGYPVIGSGGQFAFASEYMYDGEVVFLGRKGTIDKPLYFNGKFWAVDTMFYAISKSNSVCKFLYFVSTTIPFKLYSTATALPSMTQSDLNNHKIILPPIQEQKEIVEYIEATTIKIDSAISLKEQEIDKLKEYKMSLIDGVVTGKVKVS